ncbi:MAG: hypothetical protein WC291_04555 [Thermodesulfovibrionales bacterium]|jgi:hypothetical protein
MPGVYLSPANRLALQSLRDVISLNLSYGGIYIVVADPNTAETISEELRKQFSVYGLDLSASTDALTLISEMRGNGKLKTDDLVAIKSHSLSQEDLIRLLNSLNVRRELIAEKKISLLLFVDNEGLSSIPLHAKDFWSFRTEVNRNSYIKRQKKYKKPLKRQN